MGARQLGAGSSCAEVKCWRRLDLGASRNCGRQLGGARGGFGGSSGGRDGGARLAGGDKGRGGEVYWRRRREELSRVSWPVRDGAKRCSNSEMNTEVLRSEFAKG